MGALPARASNFRLLHEINPEPFKLVWVKKLVNLNFDCYAWFVQVCVRCHFQCFIPKSKTSGASPLAPRTRGINEMGHCITRTYLRIWSYLSIQLMTLLWSTLSQTIQVSFLLVNDDLWIQFRSQSLTHSSVLYGPEQFKVSASYCINRVWWLCYTEPIAKGTVGEPIRKNRPPGKS